MEKLIMFSLKEYAGFDVDNPIRFYRSFFVGRFYRRRVELCLSELKPGERILEVGFGSGVTFLNLNKMYKEINGLDTTSDIMAFSRVFEKLQLKISLKQGSVLQMPYPDNYFDSVLLISILEHLKPRELRAAFSEISRVLKKGGQAVYGIPVERPLMVFFFKLLGCNIRKHHFSTEKDCFAAAHEFFNLIKLIKMRSLFFGCLYEVVHFAKQF